MRVVAPSKRRDHTLGGQATNGLKQSLEKTGVFFILRAVQTRAQESGRLEDAAFVERGLEGGL